MHRSKSSLSGPSPVSSLPRASISSPSGLPTESVPALIPGPSLNTHPLTTDNPLTAQIPTESSNPVIGAVYADKTFACLNITCSTTHFGRLADLTRHYESQHAPIREKYYCRVEGCARSRGGAAATDPTVLGGGGVRSGRVKKRSSATSTTSATELRRVDAGKELGVGRGRSFSRKDKRAEHERCMHEIYEASWDGEKGKRKGKGKRKSHKGDEEEEAE